VPDNAEYKLFAAILRLLTVKRVCVVLFNLFQHLSELNFVSIRHRAATALLLATVFTSTPSSRHVLELEKVGLVFERKTIIVGCSTSSHKTRERHPKAVFDVHCQEVLFGEWFALWPVTWTEGEVN